MAEETESEVKPLFSERVARGFEPWLETNQAANVMISFFVLVCAVAGIGLGFFLTHPFMFSDWFSSHSSVQTTLPASIVASSSDVAALFTCADAKTINARFLDKGVQLSLSDGRQISLPQALSASGARYANPDGSFVFWNKGNTAFIQENDATTYDGCATHS